MTISKASTTSAPTTKKNRSSIGAPSQRAQSSRKGKRAWRKNVDLDEVEESLEHIRTEERVVGTALHKQTNDALFQIDVKGDDQVRKRLPKFSTALLSSTRVLAQRSAVPAVFSRTSSSSSSLKRRKLTHEEKDRLLRIGKKMRKGPFNAVIDPTQVGAGSALLEVTEAVKNSGTYDVWNKPQDEAVSEEVVGNLPRLKTDFKQPGTPHPRAHIAVLAVPAPHEGTSYNPPLIAHQSLLQTAHQIEEKRVADATELKIFKDKIIGARKTADYDNGVGVPGMTLDIPVEDEVETDSAEDDDRPAKKMPERKTKKERLKAAKRRAEKRALEEKLAQKRLLSSVTAAKSLRKTLTKTVAQRQRELLEWHKKGEEDRLKNGLAGKKLGRHVVPEGNIDVQLGEDLTESFRALKPEGNLFRDRFLNMQHRALIEPRTPVIPRKGKAKIKEYEKHAYKRFDREQ